MKQYIKDYLFLAAVAGLIISLDQWTKSWIRTNMAQGEIWSLGEIWAPMEWLSPFVRVVHWYNTGVAFGMFQGMGKFFIGLTFVVVIAIILFYPRVPGSDWTLRLAMSFQLGGAIGNLIDRITIGHVTDFISVSTFPVFNVADASITTGVCVLLLGIWIQEKQNKEENAVNSIPIPDGDTPQ